MSVIGDRQVTGGIGRNPSGRVGVDMLWLWKVFGSVISFGSGQLSRVASLCNLQFESIFTLPYSLSPDILWLKAPWPRLSAVAISPARRARPK